MNPKQNPKQRKTLLDDGWPESVEEQGLLLLVLRHYITKRYIKKCIIGRREKSYQDNILHILQVQDTSLHRILLLVFHTRNRLHTDVFAHRSFYTQMFLHTETFTHRRFYTQTLLHTEVFTHRRFTHRHFYTRKFLRTNTFTHRRFYTQTPLHTDVFTRKHFYTQTFLHTDVFTRRHFYTQTFLHRFFYTQKFLHGHFTLIRAKNVEEHVTLLLVTL